MPTFTERLKELARECDDLADAAFENDTKRYWIGRADSYWRAIDIAEHYGVA